jgi:hypothetical protein
MCFFVPLCPGGQNEAVDLGLFNHLTKFYLSVIIEQEIRTIFIDRFYRMMSMGHHNHLIRF